VAHETLTMLERVIGSLILGGIVGFERERVQKPAGLRTIMLVTLGSTLVMLLAQRMPLYTVLQVDVVTMDPTRILAALVQGIGFLGAGTIFLQRDRVRGLTTAAAIWTMAVVGAAVGVGDWALAIAGTTGAFFILHLMGALSPRLGGAQPPREKNG